MSETPPVDTPLVPPSAPLLSAADALVDELRTAISPALDQFDAEAIHKARVATRRLSAVTELVKPLTSKHHRQSFARVLRKSRRRLGALRDFDVMLEHLQILGAEAKSFQAVEKLAAHLQHDRDAERARITKKNPTHKILSRLNCWASLRVDIEAASEAVDSLLAHQLHEHLHAFDAHAVALSAPLPADRSDPHQLRIDGKRLRYTLELAITQGFPIRPKTMRAFKKMQEELGQWHDYLVLGTSAADLAKKLLEHEHDAASAAMMYELSARVLKIASRHLEAFAKRWTERGETIGATLRALFPLTRDLSAAEMDPDPPSSPQTLPSAALPPETSPETPA